MQKLALSCKIKLPDLIVLTKEKEKEKEEETKQHL